LIPQLPDPGASFYVLELAAGLTAAAIAGVADHLRPGTLLLRKFAPGDAAELVALAELARARQAAVAAEIAPADFAALVTVTPCLLLLAYNRSAIRALASLRSWPLALLVLTAGILFATERHPPNHLPGPGNPAPHPDSDHPSAPYRADHLTGPLRFGQ